MWHLSECGNATHIRGESAWKILKPVLLLVHCHPLLVKVSQTRLISCWAFGMFVVWMLVLVHWFWIASGIWVNSTASEEILEMLDIKIFLTSLIFCWRRVSGKFPRIGYPWLIIRLRIHETCVSSRLPLSPRRDTIGPMVMEISGNCTQEPIHSVYLEEKSLGKKWSSDAQKH